MPQHEVGAGFLADEAGVPIRTIQFWTDAGVLQAAPESDRQGRGRHRVYDATPPYHGELAWTLIAAELHRLHAPVGVMRRLIQFLRNDGASKSIGRALDSDYFVVIASVD